MSRRKRALRGTRVVAEGTAAELTEALDAVLARGASHAKRRQFGCAFVVVAVLTGVSLLFFTRHYYAMGIIGAFAVVAWLYTTSLDAELADDRRLRMVRNLLRTADRWGGVGRFALELELNAFDAEVPTRKTPLRAGRLRAWYAQRWLRLEQREPRRRLEIHVDAELVQDGIDVVSESVTERFEAYAGDERLALDDLPGWSEGAADGLTDFDGLRSVARATFGECG